MNNIINFKNYDEFKEFFIKQTNNNYIGSGSTAKCYLGKDNLVYKVINNIEDEDILRDYFYAKKKYGNLVDVEDFFINVNDININKIITTNDIKTDSFTFPITIFTIKDKFAGYTSKYISKDLFLNNHRNNYFEDIIDYQSENREQVIKDYVLNNLKKINFEQLKESYQKIYNDVLSLSNENIHICDLYHNLFFDGTSFIGIDTDYYTKSENNPTEHNIDELDYSIKEELECLLDIITDQRINEKLDVISYINKTEQIVKHELNNNKPKRLLKRR